MGNILYFAGLICFQFETIINKAAINMCAQVFGPLLSFLLAMSRGGTAWSYDKCMFNLRETVKHMYHNVHCSSIYNSQDVEAT